MTKIPKSLNSLSEVVEKTNLIFVSLPTPMYECGKADLSIIKTCFEEIEKTGINCKNKVFVLKSTVVPGTTET